MNNNNYDIPVFRVAIIGTSGAGKSTMVNKYINNNIDELFPKFSKSNYQYLKFGILSEDYDDEINYYYLLIDDIMGIDDNMLKNKKNKNFLNKVLNNSEAPDTNITLPPFAQKKKVHGIMFLFDLSDSQSFEKTKLMVLEIIKKEKEAKSDTPFEIKKVLIGTKSDLVENKTNSKEYEDFANKYKLKYFETSCYDNINIAECFESLIREIYFDVDIDTYEKDLRDKYFQENQGKDGTEAQKKIKRKRNNGIFNYFMPRNIEEEEYYDATESGAHFNSIPDVDDNKHKSNCNIF